MLGPARGFFATHPVSGYHDFFMRIIAKWTLRTFLEALCQYTVPLARTVRIHRSTLYRHGIEPNGASNDFRWKAVTFEGDGVHPKRLHRNHQIEIRALNVTMPVGLRSVVVGPVRRETPDGNFERGEKIRECGGVVPAARCEFGRHNEPLRIHSDVQLPPIPAFL